MSWAHDFKVNESGLIEKFYFENEAVLKGFLKIYHKINVDQEQNKLDFFKLVMIYI